jgi:hypothetical protein
VVGLEFPLNHTTKVRMREDWEGLELMCFVHQGRLSGEIGSRLLRIRRRYRTLNRQYTTPLKRLRPIPTCQLTPRGSGTLTMASPADENNIFLSSDKYRHSTLP